MRRPVQTLRTSMTIVEKRTGVANIADAVEVNIANWRHACLRCQGESKKDSYGKQDCVVVWGECNHSFHFCCMSLWVKQNNRCPLCQQEWKQDCVVVWGECNHSFHFCCISLWVKQNNRCPLCQQEWSIQRMGK
ncbi:RING-H2 zinc finger domain-containing protein [Phthorimaea operculella]|nr:RING-H2 zinc finger domain-containing protein [Phthorimaea operculella]